MGPVVRVYKRTIPRFKVIEEIANERWVVFEEFYKSTVVQVRKKGENAADSEDQLIVVDLVGQDLRESVHALAPFLVHNVKRLYVRCLKRP